MSRTWLQQQLASLPPVQTRTEDDPLAQLFDKQLEAVQALGRRKVLLCGARSGKTSTALRRAIAILKSKPNAQVCYIGITRTSAKNIAWEPLRRLNELHRWGLELNETELRARLPNGSWLLLCGSDNVREIEKFRGVPWDAVFVDECGSARPQYLEYLVISVLEPRLMDRSGELWLLGTPTPQRWGFFYEASTNTSAQAGKWRVFTWTAKSNPHLDWAREVEGPEGVLLKNGWALDNPIFRREYLAEWVIESSLLAYRFDRAKNLVAALPELDPRDSWRTIFSADFGYGDATAYVILKEPIRYGRFAYVVEAAKKYQLAPVEAAEWLSAVIQRVQPDVQVGDLNGYGKGVERDLHHRYGLALRAAKKDHSRIAHEITSDALLTGSLLCLPGTDDLQQQWATLQRDPKTGVVADGQDDDLADAAKYGYRETYSYANRTTRPAAYDRPIHTLDLDELDEDDRPKRHYLDVGD